MARILSTLDLSGSVEVAKRLAPTTFFVIPSIASTSITAGIYLAQWLGTFGLASPWIIAAGAVVIVLVVQGLGVSMPNGLRIFLELASRTPTKTGSQGSTAST